MNQEDTQLEEQKQDQPKADVPPPAAQAKDKDQLGPHTDEYDPNEMPEEPWVTDEDLANSLNTHWRKVIDGLMNYLKPFEAYAKAYEIDIDKPASRNVAYANASRLLKNVKFRSLWKKVIEENGFSDEQADWQLTDLMTNPGYDPKVRRAAVHDYNELTGRIIKKTDLTSGGKPIEQPGTAVIASAIEPRNDAAPQAEATSGNSGS